MLGKRVDALVMAWRVQLSESARECLVSAMARCEEAGKAELRIPVSGGGSVRCEIKNRGRMAVLSTDSWRGVLLLEEADREDPGWSLELVARASWLAMGNLHSILVDLRWIASAFGRIDDERLRRIDLCADFERWPIHSGDWKACVRSPRARVLDHLPRLGDDDPVDRWERARVGRMRRPSGKGSIEVAHPWGQEYADEGSRCTGWVVCPGNDTMARVYDKTAQLKISQDAAKIAFETARWKAAGWDGVERVTRVEFQLRGQTLREFRVERRNREGEVVRDATGQPVIDTFRSVDAAIRSLDAAWAYLTRSWLRLVLPGTASRLRRCDVDPRWAAVQAVVFKHEAAPVERRRIRGFASLAQGWGVIIAALGLGGELTALRPEEVDEHKATVGLIDAAGGDAERALATFVGEMVEAFGSAFAQEASKQNGGAARALRRAVVQVAATDARRARMWEEIQRQLGAEEREKRRELIRKAIYDGPH